MQSMQGYIFTIYFIFIIRKTRRNLPQGFFLSVAVLPPILAIIEKVLDVGGILRIYGYRLFHDGIESKKSIDQ